MSGGHGKGTRHEDAVPGRPTTQEPTTEPQQPDEEEEEPNDETASQSHKSRASTTDPKSSDEAPTLPEEEIPPPLPDEPPPPAEDDGWDPVWDATAQAYYFYNRITQKTQWENPRLPQSTSSIPPAGLAGHDRSSGGADLQQVTEKSSKGANGAGGGYNPAIHGDYDPNADYAQVYNESEDEAATAAGTTAQAVAAGGAVYETSGAFNRFTGRWQATSINPENHNDENKSKRQMNAFFDVDAAANSHDGKSLKAERQNKKLSKKEIKAFKEKRRDRKEEKRRAWLRD